MHNAEPAEGMAIEDIEAAVRAELAPTPKKESVTVARLTTAEIWTACDELISQGKAPSLRAVRQSLGNRGSYSRLGREVRTWRVARGLDEDSATDSDIIKASAPAPIAATTDGDCARRIRELEFALERAKGREELLTAQLMETRELLERARRDRDEWADHCQQLQQLAEARQQKD